MAAPVRGRTGDASAHAAGERERHLTALYSARPSVEGGGRLLQYSSRLACLSPNHTSPSLPPLHQQPVPLTEEERRLVSRAALNRAVAALDPTARLAPGAEDALMEVVASFVGDALAAGAAVARRRRAPALAPSDVGPYLARAWHVHVPGAGADGVGPGGPSAALGPGGGHPRRPTASDLHRARMAAVRRAREAGAAAEAAAAGGAGGGASGGGGSAQRRAGRKGRPPREG